MDWSADTGRSGNEARVEAGKSLLADILDLHSPPDLIEAALLFVGERDQRSSDGMVSYKRH
ncbi:hypothetical protein AA309_29035 [Microvirga vignae]|uniref:Uncharacterized protein n=1 Tax=Microvirga vignae TaxID=1225564 RepID=A0A0H1R422_9HYPH|nr:hypothetical protein AA309_29035 [Microvirga vignae]